MPMMIQTPENLMSAPLINNQSAYSKKSISNFRRKLYRKQNDEESQACNSSVPR